MQRARRNRPTGSDPHTGVKGSDFSFPGAASGGAQKLNSSARLIGRWEGRWWMGSCAERLLALTALTFFFFFWFA